MTEIPEEKPRRDERREHGVAWPLFLIVLGILLLLNNFGLVSASAWSLLGRLWPLLLVVAGVEVFVGTGTGGRIVSFVVSLLLLLVVFSVVLSATDDSFARSLRRQFPWWPVASPTPRNPYRFPRGSL